MADTMESVGQVIRETRKSRGMSQDELAAKARINRSYLSEAERGANISLDVLERIVAALDIRELPISGRSVRLLFPEGLNRASDAARVDRLIRDTDAATARLVVAWNELTSQNVATFPREAPQPKPLTSIADAPIFTPVRVVAEDMLLIEIVGYVAAGAGIDLLTEGHGETREVPVSEAPRDPSWVALIARGDSMVEFGINDGDLVYVEPRKGGVAATNEIVIGWLSSREGLVIKKWYAKKGKRMLLSGNEDYSPIEITEEGEFELQAIVRYHVPRLVKGREFPNISGKKSRVRG